ncbi:hypothetical protein LTR96_010936 [Exophiala xenobiotica]|nr:hypothetical protein LTR96_010936 [Exophiala xenobiotica]KAK5313131.1 hypothetical protein LTR93_011066 [Exophiala xenobiotica]KAK5332728.1 hypothetical protein LTR98_011138 [Exophiala xenobiotica]KAK5345132.1 hypothetical protein LTR61_011091 [Exophiala xenobiotica]KAK5358380.1 hypothetical protein LTS13_010931 [Exophiala xenobiotica]
MENITRAISNLKLDTEVENYLHVQELEEKNLSKKDLKSVACTASKSPVRNKTCSGWTGSNTWYNYDILDRKGTTLLALQVAEETNYTFPAHWKDCRDLRDIAYRPGRSKACHAETQLMAYIYDKHYRGPTAVDKSIDIYIYPRPLELRISLKSYTRAAVNLAQSLEAFAKTLKIVEEDIISNVDDNHALRQLLPVFVALGPETSRYRQAVVESVNVMECATYAMLSI